MKKDKGVMTKVHSEYYRMLEKTRMVLERKHNIRIKSHKELTRIMSKAPPIYNNKKWIRKLKQTGY